MPTPRVCKCHGRLQTVRPRSAGIPVLLCVLMFALTATLVNRVGRERWKPVNSQVTYTATAYAVDSKSGVKTPFPVTDGDRQRAIDTANELADAYVSDRVAQWRRSAERRRVACRESAERARREYRESLKHLEDFKRQLTEAAKVEAKAQAEKTREKPQRTMVDNPEWVELNRKVMDIERRRDQLLQDRTPLHPAVQEVTTKLQEAKDRLAAVPRQIKGEEPPAQVADKRPGVGANRTEDLIAAANKKQLEELTGGVNRSREALEKADRLDRQAAQQQHAGPQLVIENAKCVRNEPQVDYGWRRLLWTTFASGLLMAFGVASVAAGARIEPPVASEAEVESLLGQPSLGTMPAESPTVDLESIRRQSHARRATIAIGVIVIFASPVVAVWGVLGI